MNGHSLGYSGNHTDANGFPFGVRYRKLILHSLIEYETYTLNNGLTVVLHHDPKRTVVAVNVLYKVGSRNDPPGRTGFAHLFEHLMFAGSENVPDFDDALQLAGGENNAFTSADYTLYHETLPAANLETALWLESDRMRQLRFSEQSLMVYKVHPYRWPVIGEKFEHIEEATLADVKDFFYRYYRPDNAVLSVAGGFQPDRIRGQIAEWFADIPASSPDHLRPELPVEPEQKETRRKTVTADVPSPVVYLNFRTPGRLHPDFPAIDILCFLLGTGRSSLLYRRLVRDGDLFAEVSASHNDSLDSGAILIDARPAEDANYADARTALFSTIREMKEKGVSQEQLDKVINRLEQSNHYKTISVVSRATELAFYASLGEPDMINTELDRYLSVTVEDVNRVAREYLREELLSEVEYLVEEEE